MKSDIRLSESVEHVVRASRDDPRKWLAGTPVCPALARHGIVHVGVAHVTHPYQVRRPDLSGTFLMVCVAGEGRVWLEGRWQPLQDGQACLAPPHAFHAYRAISGQWWRIAWVRYQEPEGSWPMVNAPAPALTQFDGRALEAAVEGLHREASAAANPAAMELWADLIQHYAQAAAGPWRTDDRLRTVWEAVNRDLAAPWSVDSLATLAGLGTQQFRRLCRRTLGRTPAHQVAWLRLQHAAMLLATSDEKVEVVARRVGYASLFTFSRLFQKFTGWRPSAYRRHATSSPTKSSGV